MCGWKDTGRADPDGVRQVDKPSPLLSEQTTPHLFYQLCSLLYLFVPVLEGGAGFVEGVFPLVIEVIADLCFGNAQCSQT